MTPLVVIRPRPGCDSTVAAARELGLDARAFPLFAVAPCDWAVPDPAGYDAVLAGSANAFRHGGAGLAALRALPVLAVGRATAEAARGAGFTVARTGEGGLQALLDDLAPQPTRLLRLAGHDRVRLDVPAGVHIDERVVYASQPLALPAGLAEVLARPCVVALHSARAAEHFDRLSAIHAVPRGAIALAAIGPRVARAAGKGWARVRAADRPDDAALLALAARMCQTGHEG